MADKPIKSITLENGDKRTFIPIPATESEYGGIKASPATEADTQEVKLGTDGKLYTKNYPLYPAFESFYLRNIAETKGIAEAMKIYINIFGGESLTESVNSFYGLISGDGKVYTSRFYRASVSNSGDGDKLDDNTNLVCEPSTATIAGRDDYAKIPLFEPLDCNYRIDAETLDTIITQVDGVTDGFSRTKPDGLCGVIQMTGYVHRHQDETYKWVHYSDVRVDENYAPLPEAIRVDNTVRNFVTHAKYVAGYDENGLLTSASGLNPVAYNGKNTSNSISFNGQIAMFRKLGVQYSGSSICDRNFLQLMLEIKYGKLYHAGIMNGCRNYNLCYQVAVAEENVNRVILTTSQASNLIVGSCVIIGHLNGTSNDRNNASMRDVANMVRITSIEPVNIGDVNYSAVYVDSEPFNVDIDAKIETSPWYSGWCDRVLGNDGTCIDPKQDKEPIILQRIEFMVGAYEVLGDTYLKYNGDGTVSVMNYKLATQIQSGGGGAAIQLNDVIYNPNTSDQWRPIAETGSEQITAIVPVDTTSTSTSHRHKCSAYLLKNTATNANEWLAGGSLYNGSHAGLASLHGNNWLGYAYWSIAARPSAIGGRGEFVA